MCERVTYIRITVVENDRNDRKISFASQQDHHEIHWIYSNSIHFQSDVKQYAE